VLDAIEQSRRGNTISVLITVRRTTDGPCIQVIELFERNIRLEGPFGPGRYTVRVNDVVREVEI
jgi:hypothetical protein